MPFLPVTKEELSKLTSRAWLEIDFDAVEHNYRLLQAQVAPQELILMLKADAYGHGAQALASFYQDLGARYFGVACLEEAVDLREAGIKGEILVLSYPLGLDFTQVQSLDLSLCVANKEQVEELLAANLTSSAQLKVQIKVDTGMHRLGLAPTNANVDLIVNLARQPAIAITGLFTHLATADGADAQGQAEEFAQEQLQVFRNFQEQLALQGLKPTLTHVSNSAASLTKLASDFAAVRLGLALYGINPLADLSLDLRPVQSFYSRIVGFKDLRAGDSVSYARRYEALDKEQAICVAAGYGDGYKRSLSNKALALYKGHEISQIGTICMDLSMFRVPASLGQPKLNEQVLLWGKNSEGEIPVTYLAKLANTIPYELLVAPTKRVKRLYFYKDSYYCHE